MNYLFLFDHEVDPTMNEINVETSDLNPRVMCTSKSNKKSGEPT
jgi:hypothetical protein